MVTAAVICEYNPFHKGHLHQIDSIRERFGSDCAVMAIMSGPFVQRGEGAVMDKWKRTKAAMLAGGINLVIELPVFYATASAELFAQGGVALADATGICDYLVFGSESGDIDRLKAIAELLIDESPAFKLQLRTCLETGISFPAARALALEELMPELEAVSILKESNNILAVEYLKALKLLPNSRMKPFTFRRKGQSYSDSRESIAEPLRSASSIRAAMNRPGITLSDLIVELSVSVPNPSLSVLASAIRNGECIRSQNAFSSLALSKLITMSVKEINSEPGMNEGLGTRLAKSAGRIQSSSNAWTQLIQLAASKRFPASRVSRALTRLVLGITSEDTRLLTQPGNPGYLRILGFDKKGQYLLKKLRKSSALPVIMNGSDFLEFPDRAPYKALRRMADLDHIGTDIHTLITGGSMGRDYTTPPISFLKQPTR